MMKLMVEREEGGERKILCEHPHSTWEDDFSGDQNMNWVGGNVFGAMIMCSRDQLSGDIEGQ